MTPERAHPSTPWRLPLPGLVLVAVAAGACGPVDRGTGNVPVRDSAGVTIVESTRPAWSGGKAWTVSPIPVLDLATAGDGEAHRFYGVVDATLLADGTLAVAEGRAGTIKLFDADGRHLRTLGAPGEGPGEFARLLAVSAARGDSLAAFDPRNRRITIFSRDGTGQRVVPLTPAFPRAAMPLDDSTFAVVAGQAEFVPGDPGHVRRPVRVLTVTMAGEVRDTLAHGAGAEAVSLDGGLVDARPLFGKNTHVAVQGGRVFVGDADRFEVRTIGPDGGLERIARVPGYDLALSEEAVAAEVAARLSLNDTPRARELIARLPRPPNRPAYADLLVDGEGAVWLERHDGWFRNRLDPAPRPWEVLAPDGRWLGRVELPARLTVFEIGSDWILGSLRDELDVEHPVLYRLSRADGG